MLSCMQLGDWVMYVQYLKGKERKTKIMSQNFAFLYFRSRAYLFEQVISELVKGQGACTSEIVQTLVHILKIENVANLGG